MVGDGVRPMPPTLYHGTTEQALSRAVLDPRGLRPQGGTLYLTDDPNYARLRAGIQAKELRRQGLSYDPIILAVSTPSDVERVGRHFVLHRPLPTRSLTVTTAARLRHDRGGT